MTPRRTTSLIAALAVVVLAALPAAATAAAESACSAIGGTVGADQTCHSHTDNTAYTLDFAFPVDYPDQAALTEYLTQRRDSHVAGELDIIGHGYRSATTQSLVLTIGNQAGVHPVTSYQAFNYNLDTRTPITFETLFKPGTRPMEVLNPIVQPELDQHGATGLFTLEELGAKAYRNFAITDDAVIFFFDQDVLLPHERGPLTVNVPRTQLGALLA